jgi:hypothetical protein
VVRKFNAQLRSDVWVKILGAVTILISGIWNVYQYQAAHRLSQENEALQHSIRQDAARQEFEILLWKRRTDVLDSLVDSAAKFSALRGTGAPAGAAKVKFVALIHGPLMQVIPTSSPVIQKALVFASCFETQCSEKELALRSEDIAVAVFGDLHFAIESSVSVMNYSDPWAALLNSR